MRAFQSIDKRLLFEGISARVTLDGTQIFNVGDGGFRKSALIDGWVLVPPAEKFG